MAIIKPKYLVGFSSTILLALGLFWWLRTPTATVEGVNHLIDVELPKGATVAQVNAFLDSRKIIHSSVPVAAELDSDFHANPKLNGKREQVKGRTGAIIRNAESGFLVSWSIMIGFYFDEHGRLVEHTVRKIGTGM